MPRYEIEVDGAKYEVEAPDDSAIASVVDQIRAGGNQSQKASFAGGMAGAAALGAGDTLSFGFGDELGAGLGASSEYLASKFTGEKPRSYSELLAAMRDQEARAEAENPGSYLTGQIAGGVTGGVGLARGGLSLAANAVEKGAKLGKTAIASGLDGFALGSMHGFGTGEGGAVERLSPAWKEGVIGGLSGAALAPVGAAANKAVSAITRRILGESNDALSTMTEQGRRYVVDELSDPSKMGGYRDRLRELGPDATLADVSPEWLGVARGSAARPGTRGLVVDPLNERSALANTRLRADVADNLGPDPIPSRVDRAIEADQDIVGRQYGPVMRDRQNYDFTPITDALSDEIQRVRGPAQQQLRNVRQMLNVNGQDMVTTDPAIAFETRQAIDGILKTELNPKVISALTEARQMIDDGLRASVPRIKEVDAQFSELARQREALGEGRSIMNNGATAMRPVELDDALRQGALPQGEMIGPSGVPLRMQQSSLGELYRAIGTEANDLNALRKTVRGEGDWNREKLGMMFGQDRADNVLNAIDRENIFADTANRVTRGSDTAMGRRFTEFLDDVSKGQEIPTSATLTGAAGRLFQSIMKRMIQGNADTNAGKLAEDIGRLSVATGTTRDQIVEAILRRGQENVLDKQRMAVVNGFIQGGGRGLYPSLPGLAD